MTNNHKPQASPQQFKKFQEDEDYEGGGGGIPIGIGGGTFEVGNLVPMIFKLVGSAISLNSSGLVEGSFGLLPVGVSNQITSVLGSLANNFLGPGIIGTTTRRPPPRRRRTRSTTTTTEATTTEMVTDKTTESPTTTTNLKETATASSLEITNSTFEDVETKLNETIEMDIGNITQLELTTEEVPGTTSTEVLFKESSLGENPVYAAAYAPNYVATTPYPVYASNFIHALYPAPSTVATTTTTTSAPSTSTDPNSYAVELPFDYMEGIGFGTGAPPMVHKEGMHNVSTPPPLPQNVTYAPLPVYMQSTPDYEYEYEEHTDEAKVKRESEETSAKSK